MLSILHPKAARYWPRSLKRVVGSVQGSKNLLTNNGVATLSGNQSYVTLDFGIEIGGLISMNFDSVAPTSGVALSFTESPMFINPLASDDSSMSAINNTYDGVENLPTPLVAGFWTQPASRLRGGFRFLTYCFHLNLSGFHFQRVFGYFFASDPVFHDKDFLTKIWYAGAYTLQTNTVPLHTGRQIPFVPSPGWQNDATLGVAGPIIVDGAKRDRAVWPGDMGVAVPTQFVSTNDLLPTKNALSTMFAAIDPKTGALPESGPSTQSDRKRYLPCLDTYWSV
ncbi:hypothetical protein QCA50_016101 [Cerrena zonata]|uniref:Uncharacterized protein n=1 Tax=Cerrena zonata TaxID=2478898 RepID=A0AAW0FTC5_9APHY